MTPQELAAFRELAGLNAPSPMEQNKAWADKQIGQRPPAGAVTPLNNLALKLQGIDQNGSKGAPPIDPDKNLDGLADRLNTLMRTPGTPPRPTEQKQPDPTLDNVANRLNSLLGHGNFKVERLN